MARIKRGVTAKARHKKVLALAKGYRGRSNNTLSDGAERVEKGAAVRLSRPAQPQARFPRAVDPADQRRGARRGADLRPADARPQERRDRDRPQGAGRCRGARRRPALRAWPSRPRSRSRVDPRKSPESAEGAGRPLFCWRRAGGRQCRGASAAMDVDVDRLEQALLSRGGRGRRTCARSSRSGSRRSAARAGSPA